MKKKSFSITFAYVGVLIGAGLSSGQEAMQYFIPFGEKGLLGLIVVGLLHIFVGGILLQLGSHFIAESHIDVLKNVSEKYLTKFMDFALILNCFLMGFVMIAGAGSILNQQFGIPKWIGSIICTIMIISIGMLDFDKVTEIMGAFTPLVLIFTLIGTFHTITTTRPDFAALDALGKTLKSPLPNVVLSSLNYFGMCMVSGISMAFVLGGRRTDSSEARFIGIFGGSLVAILTALIGYTTFVSLNEIIGTDIPMQMILHNIHPVLGLLMTIIIFGMIFNTAIALFYSAARRFSNNEIKFKRNLVIFTFIGFILSFLGFKELMGVLYPILGYLGDILVVVLVIAWLKGREAIKKENDKRDKLTDLTRKKYKEEKSFDKEDVENLEKFAESSIIENEKIKKAVEEEIEEEIHEETKRKRE